MDLGTSLKVQTHVGFHKTTGKPVGGLYLVAVPYLPHVSGKVNLAEGFLTQLVYQLAHVKQLSCIKTYHMSVERLK